MAVTLRRGRVVDYFVEVTDPETAAGTIEDNAVELRALVPLLPPAPEYARPRWRRNLLAFGVSLAASTALLSILVRVVAR